MIPTPKEFFLELMHPRSSGWNWLRGKELDEIRLDVVLVKKGLEPIIVLHMDSAYVLRDDIELANHLMQVYQHRMNGRTVKVMLVYDRLLIPPKNLPKGVSVVSVAEGGGEEKPHPWDETVSLN